MLALPGLLFLAAFAPLVVQILYSQKFAAAGELLQWMALGAFCRVLSWPAAYVQLAKGEAIWFGGTQTVLVLLQAVLTLQFLHAFGIVGAAYSLLRELRRASLGSAVGGAADDRHDLVQGNAFRSSFSLAR